MSKPKVLLVENSKIGLQIEKRYLKETAAVFTANNGEEGVRIAGNIRPDLVYLALHLPGMSGTECCRILKSSSDDIRVVMVCAAGGDEQDLCRAAGCDSVISKPLKRREFLEAGLLYLPVIMNDEEPLPCRASVLCALKNSIFYGTLENLCSNGMFVGSTWDVAPGEVLSVKFVLPWSGASLIETAAEVTWINAGKRVRNSQLPAGFSLIFRDMADDAAEQIKDYIELTRMRAGR